MVVFIVSIYNLRIYNLQFILKKLLILVDAMGGAGAVTLTLAIPFALGTEIVAEHGSEDKVFLRRQLVERTGDDEFDGLQTLAPSEIHVQVLLSSRLQDVGDALTLQPLNGQLTIFLITREEHHLAHALVEFVDVVHQDLDLRGNRRRSHILRFCFLPGAKVRRKNEVRNT